MIDDFATWLPLLKLIRLDPGGHAAGQISRGSWSVPVPKPQWVPGRAAQVSDMQEEWDAVGRVRDALIADGREGLSFVVEAQAPGRRVLHLIDNGPAVETGLGPYPGSLVLVDGAVPEPWRRLPEPAPTATPAPSADPGRLERTLRDRIPGAIGATEAEIAAAEARLGVAMPEELKALYRVTRGQWKDWGDDYEAAERASDAVGCELFPLEEVYIADAASRPSLWQFAATEAVVTPPGAAVQGLVGSPGWIAFGDNGGGDRLAIDLTPGPGGHIGQIIMIDHEQNIRAALLAESLTDMVLNGRQSWRSERTDEPPVVARINIRSLPSIEAAVDPRLEVLGIGVWQGEPLSLVPVMGLTRLRTLTAYPGTLADPLEIGRLTGLEFLRLGPREWRTLLDAGALPPGLLAAGIEVPGSPNPLSIVELANEILGRFGRPPITRTVLEGSLP
ncbi:SMI1/KNR4 family protein [Actinoplanes sp. NBC_00393]|uniref:SMI1/KNR4 family protein n=1 Tax=Actinoplanes sp. NBC_00393 TaxID=2975953 RepID=UPI002E1EEED4